MPIGSLPRPFPIGDLEVLLEHPATQHLPAYGRVLRGAMTDNERRTDIALAVLASASIAGIVLIGRAA
jgi:hypothetical protein